jgi:hypothetical protein
MRTRKRHYLITLQKMYDNGVMRYSTQHGEFEGDDDEGAAFELIVDAACAKATALFTAEGLSGTWSRDNSAVLFYRLADCR